MKSWAAEVYHKTMNNANTSATVVVLTRSGGRVFRKFTVTSLDEVVTVWKNHRGGRPPPPVPVVTGATTFLSE
ncbi:MAG: hypothetical protein EBT77_03035 [Verrucomicrobia bacterium]|nr:hypothetical protein [Verrucomicrobiota bacterium]